MFWAALAAQCAGEPSITANRIIAALLRTETVRELCARARIDFMHLFTAVDDPATLSFDECERQVRRELAETGIELGSKEHQATVQLRPIEPAVRRVFDSDLTEHGRFAVPPRELLLKVMRADGRVAERLAREGLTVEVISRAIEEE